ncbi:leucyl aminopeptidase [Micrococcus terreus]|uniref:Probable cytosol aminopeptidase n=1 Tax=Micrococcus terreus TaxID=574650 RepID=A0A1I7MKM9_9MICC|nr:leucyl aminopeptidase [Micrococcus terreus]MCT2089108.1 leucyl aminopeptidase [Micrococcus terreus]SFV22478.1 leucyl aminopeptidase [Micrococcus terreus]
MISDFSPQLTAIGSDLRRSSAQALVVAVASTEDGPVLLPNPLADSAARALADSLEALGVTGAADEVVRIPGMDSVPVPVLVLTGVGSLTGEAGSGVSAEALRRAAGAAIRHLAGTTTAALALPADSPEQLGAVAEGASYGAYSFTGFRSAPAQEKARKKAPVQQIEIVTDLKQKAVKPVLDRAAVLGRAVRATRDLVNTPPSHLFPASFAETVSAAAGQHSLKVTVWDEKKLEKEGFGGILNVGKGSSRPPRLVKVEYSPAKSKNAAHIALVGKGITFDSGGISLKPPASMMTMKSDMTGAATVASVITAAAELQLPIKVTGWLCLAENMPSGTATRPSDVITIFGGKTVEVMNTDAEGRLVMADGLVAATNEAPDAVIDIATLTGAQMIALGTRTTGVMGTEDLRDEVVRSADAAGETAWAMPIPENMRKSLDSSIADISNVGDRFGGMMAAAAFLRDFVDAGRDAAEAKAAPTPWAHLDIAGPSFNESAPWGYTPKDATGVMVRTLVQFLEGRAGVSTAAAEPASQKATGRRRDRR